jgi:hypothetical protein
MITARSYRREEERSEKIGRGKRRKGGGRRSLARKRAIDKARM